MSKWLDKSDALAAKIATLDGVAEGNVVVDRQQEIATRVRTAVAKRSGFLASILWRGGRNPDRKAAVLRMGGNYSIFCWFRPVLRIGDTAADEIVETIAEGIHGWVDSAGPNDFTRRLEVVDVRLVPNSEFMIYEIIAEILRV